MPPAHSQNPLNYGDPSQYPRPPSAEHHPHGTDLQPQTDNFTLPPLRSLDFSLSSQNAPAQSQGYPPTEYPSGTTPSSTRRDDSLWRSSSRHPTPVPLSTTTTRDSGTYSRGPYHEMTEQLHTYQPERDPLSFSTPSSEIPLEPSLIMPPPSQPHSQSQSQSLDLPYISPYYPRDSSQALDALHTSRRSDTRPSYVSTSSPSQNYAPLGILPPSNNSYANAPNFGPRNPSSSQSMSTLSNSSIYGTLGTDYPTTSTIPTSHPPRSASATFGSSFPPAGYPSASASSSHSRSQVSLTNPYGSSSSSSIDIHRTEPSRAGTYPQYDLRRDSGASSTSGWSEPLMRQDRTPTRSPVSGLLPTSRQPSASYRPSHPPQPTSSLLTLNPGRQSNLTDANQSINQIADHCRALTTFARHYVLRESRPGQLDQPSLNEMQQMAQRATIVVQLLESLRLADSSAPAPAPAQVPPSSSVPSSSSNKRSWETFQGSDRRAGASPPAYRPPPLRVIIETGRQGYGPITSEDFGDIDPGSHLDPEERTTAEQDMATIRRKRHASTDGGMGDTGAQDSIPLEDNDMRKKSMRPKPEAPVTQCTSCGSRETPEWRRGPEGPRTLCNACGLHYAKAQRDKGENPDSDGEGSGGGGDSGPSAQSRSVPLFPHDDRQPRQSESTRLYNVDSYSTPSDSQVNVPAGEQLSFNYEQHGLHVHPSQWLGNLMDSPSTPSGASASSYRTPQPSASSNRRPSYHSSPPTSDSHPPA